ncbi:MAG: hypothetical protein M0R70_05680 [Nitrospirae bacterium]|nr:hypothetical protein [Nitrospirota bacterium]
MNYYTPLSHDHKSAFETCLVKVLEIAAENNCNQILLLVPQRGMLTGVIEDTLGHKCINALISKKKAFLSPITFFLQTKRAKPDGFVFGPVLAAYAYIDQLKELDKDKTSPGIVWYTDEPHDLEAFKKIANVKELDILFDSETH